MLVSPESAGPEPVVPVFDSPYLLPEFPPVGAVPAIADSALRTEELGAAVTTDK